MAEEHTYETDRYYILKTLDRFEQLNRDHSGELASMRDNLENKFRTDLNNAWATIKQQGAKIERLNEAANIRKGRQLAMAAVWGTCLAAAIELMKHFGGHLILH